jgi:hypothetical protein
MVFKDILVYVDRTATARVRMQLALTLTRRLAARLPPGMSSPEENVRPCFRRDIPGY